MIILSIDPGLEKTGYALLDKNNKYSQQFKFLCSGLIKTNKNLSTPHRLKKIYFELLDIINKNKPKVVVIEEIFFFKNQKTFIKVSQAQGVILLLVGQKKLDIFYFSPLKIKQIITGYGLSDKKAIKKMIDLTIKLNKKFVSDDEYDAIACGLAYCFQNRKLL